MLASLLEKTIEIRGGADFKHLPTSPAIGLNDLTRGGKVLFRTNLIQWGINKELCSGR